MYESFKTKRDPGIWLALLVATIIAAPLRVDATEPSREQQQARAALEKNHWEFSENRFVTLSSTAKREVIELYLKAGMSLNAKDAGGRPAIVAVLANGKLFSGDALGSMGHALLRERLDALQYLLSAGADPNIADTNGITALHEAGMYRAFVPAIKPLIKAGARLDVAESKYNFNPLHMAVLSNNVEGVRELLAAGANPDGLAKQSFTALMFALNAGNDSIVDLLLQAGADPLRKTDGGKTCLHFAAEGASENSISSLLAKGASIVAVDGNQKTPLQLAQDKNRDQAILSLLSHQ